MNTRAALRAIPSVDSVLELAGQLAEQYGHDRVVREIRTLLDTHRERLLAGEVDRPLDAARVLDAARSTMERAVPSHPRRVINATGVIVHTNLGRAPLPQAAVAAMVDAAGYCDLEYDLTNGERGSRGTHIEHVLAELVGGHAATAVNNAAAALVLAVATLAGGRQVIVSRGELIEIGGSFRLPDIIASAGASLVEVGTTNRTHSDDYMAGDDAALLLKMHPSNYRVVGFTSSPSVPELADVATRRGIPLLYDVGSGLIDQQDVQWARNEPSLRGALRDGADMVIASGDKLLGGPQAGLMFGRYDLIERCRAHPLARAMRVDKTRIAALNATLEIHRSGRARSDIPIWRMLSADSSALRSRTEALAARLDGAVVAEGVSVPGGGSAPGAGIEGPVLHLHADRPDDATKQLRTGKIPLIVRVEDDRLVVDLRTVDPTDDDYLVEALRAC